MLEAFVTALLAEGAAATTIQGLKAALAYVSKARPDLAKKAEAAERSGNLDELKQVLDDVTGVITADAGTGKIAIDGATVRALKGAKFDHQHGTVSFDRATVIAKRIVTGGGENATGTTNITGTSLRTAGTSIEVGSGASITITGGAKIEQT